MVPYIKKIQMVKIIFIFVTLLSSHFVSAVSLSTYRIYLDRQQRDFDFTVSNRDEEEQQCKLSLTHPNIDKDGNVTMVYNDIIPENSAVDLLRYSPRNFIIPPFKAQTVRFRMRSKKGIEAKEYRSYLAINCSKIMTKLSSEENANSNNALSAISYNPKLVHQVPIIVRPLTLKTQIDIAEINFNAAQEMVTFSVLRQGAGSFFGKLELIDKSTNKSISYIKNIKIYPEMDKKDFNFSTTGVSGSNLLIRLTENTLAGGDLVLNRLVIDN